MVSVLMATYNGENFIKEQIESILSQRFADFTLSVRDDCSTDRTPEILRRYQKRFPEKVQVSSTVMNTGSAKYNFYGMMADIRSDYAMLCDQDDVWLPGKIEKTFHKMQEMERRYGRETPIVVHTDLRVVDCGLKVLRPSFARSMNLDCSRTSLGSVVAQNTLTGCACMYNRALAALIGKTPPEYMIMHDWWLLLLGAAFGHVGYLDEATILYRQHGGNEVGAKDVRSLRYKLERALGGEAVRQSLAATYRQTENFLRYYRDRLSPAQTLLLEEYASTPHQGKLKRWRILLRHKALKHGFSRKLAQFYFV